MTEGRFTEEEYVEWAKRRLGDRPIPGELLRMVAIQAARPPGADRDADPLHEMEITVLGPGSTHPVFDDDANRKIGGSWSELLSHLFPAVETFNSPSLGDGVYGYWLHPDERAARPPIVAIDSEGTFFAPRGSTLLEALINDSGIDDEAFACLADRFAAVGLPISPRSRAEIPKSAIVMDPEVLERTVDAEHRAAHAAGKLFASL
ncbi:hypothetical protein OG884_11320 [Streptosporangium sp. NBC_01755]|uniref:hypothetical protein n=1 Tax=unclassified Streptosporangium TaxID=2632669 RepID=UPI002DD9C309|nr:MULTISPECIES: hypothetical protein [unclassified Streptosporangium]WSA26108.1 hypothetical protein OIE13_35355 [Streptosporangium sp. NBC_01810]WSD02462.1 hypothetical protein OG884_11320 [Streptosporangium sp. NBC_01755]